MPQYKKVFDIGTYTGNGGQYRVGIPTLRGVGPSGYQDAGSLRFRSSNSNALTKSFGTPTNNGKWTWCAWVKRSTIGGWQGLFYGGSTGPSNVCTELYFYSDDSLYYQSYNGVTNQGYLQPTQAFKDSSAWYHIVMVVDVTNSTANYRNRLYINGVEVTSFASRTNHGTTDTLYFNNASYTHYLGESFQVNTSSPAGRFLDGYMSEVYFVDGQALTPSSFGELNSDGIWVPKAYSGTYGTNGFYLPMNTSSNYATDQSGNGNNWTPTGFNVTTSNTTYDLVTDSPTDYGTDTGIGAQVRGNYATMNSLFNLGSQASIINGGLTATKTTSSGYYNLMFSHFPMSSGKWYFEVTNGSTADISLGITTSITAERTAGNAGGSSSGYVYSNWTGQKRNNGTSSTYGATFTQNDVIGVALDMDNGTLVFYKNGVSQGTAFTGISGTAFAEIGDAGNTQTTGHLNFGQRAFAYTAPSGYKAVCTANITRPADSSLWFYGDTPDLMWIKNRTTTGLHTITDTVRGMGLNLVTSSTAAETSYPGVTEMNKFGMSIINDSTSILNGSTNSHVYWGWKAGGATVTNTSGTITSQVSANPSVGFSIVGWTGTGSAATVGHGLGAVPNMIIMRNRASASWPVYHSSIGNTGALFLNLTNSTISSSTYFNNTSPTSSVFSVGDATSTNGSTNSMIAYCWAAIPGYSAFGSYTGNGSTDGPFVYCGFRPRWVLIKSSSAITNWWIWDVSRNTFNVMTSILYPDLSNAEYSDSSTFLMDALSNGFKYRTSNATVNGSGTTYIYAAFAEAPFKVARAR